ncbi:MAG: hypothetical protein RL186_1012 [Pseudomonadota bacterium]
MTHRMTQTHVTQLSLIPALEAARAASASGAPQPAVRSGSASVPAPTPAQIAYLKRLTRITGITQLKRYVARRLGQTDPNCFTRPNVAKVINMEVSERRLAA